VRHGDMIVVDIEGRQLRVEVPETELSKRMGGWQPPAPHYKTGVMAKYANSVSSASVGAVTG
jgi:dihydroxy-acid dehydratase